MTRVRRRTPAPYSQLERLTREAVAEAIKQARPVGCWKANDAGDATCLLDEDHDDPCDFTPDEEITVG